MAQYTAIFTKPYEDGYENLPSQNTPITAETLNDKDDAIVNIETYLSGNDIPSDAEGLSYDNTDSGLTADNVQSAIDEIVTDIPTTAEDIGYDNTDSGLTADNVQGAIDELNDEKVDKTGVDVKTNTTGQFNTITGGILNSCVVNLEPIQSGSGTPSPQNVRPITGHTAVEVDVTDADSNTTQYTVALGQTVYGGSLDVVSGVLTVDKAGVDMGSLSWTLYQANIFTADVTGRKFGNFNILCSMYPVSASTTIGGMQDEEIKGLSDNNKVIIKDSSYSSDASALITAVTGQQLVYELATPLTIQLTPTQINTLIGENHLDIPLTGQSLDSAVYRELFAWNDVNDVVKAVDDKNADVSAIGTDESGRTTASKSYAQGEHFYKDGKFCTAIASISSGATLTLNTNYVEGTIADNFDIQDVKSAFTFSTDCTWDNNWTKIYKVGSVIMGCLRFIMPSTVSADKIIITAPSKYQCKDSYRALSPLSETWTGANNGIIGFSNNKTYIRILSTTWTGSKNVIASFEYPIG